MTQPSPILKAILNHLQDHGIQILAGRHLSYAGVIYNETHFDIEIYTDAQYENRIKVIKSDLTRMIPTRDWYWIDLEFSDPELLDKILQHIKQSKPN